jgi:hypothetical protein
MRHDMTNYRRKGRIALAASRTSTVRSTSTHDMTRYRRIATHDMTNYRHSKRRTI